MHDDSALPWPQYLQAWLATLPLHPERPLMRALPQPGDAAWDAPPPPAPGAAPPVPRAG
jgi:hypothetical protein